jgi:hypothetical protein
LISRPRAFALAFIAIVSALAPPLPVLAAEDEEEEEEDDLQQRLTEREDKRRPLVPFRVPLFDHELTLGGELESEWGYVRPRVLEDEVDGKTVREHDEFLMQQQLELEAFYSIGKELSAFLQGSGILEQDLLGRTFEGVSDRYLERGEMWLYSEDLFGSGVNLDLGRLDFEDDRRWWWDDELDAVRLAYEGETFEITLALAYELASDRSDQNFVEPEQERVLRWISESSWDYAPNHSLQLFLLHQDDHSPTENVGQSVSAEREDDSDARLTWFGARATGLLDLGPRGYLGYWLDAALVRGEERALDFGDPLDGRVEVEDVARHDVSGWAFDVGLNWLLPLPNEPRVFAGYAFGSEEFRQTGIEADEAGFGGVERFHSYGLLLQPELANLGIVTAGAGIALFRSSSLDLVYHHYRLVALSEELRESLLQFQLDGEHRELGHGVDLVLAVEEWERFEFDVAVSALRTSNAFGEFDAGSPAPDDIGGRRWVVGGFLAVRYAF